MKNLAEWSDVYRCRGPEGTRALAATSLASGARGVTRRRFAALALSAGAAAAGGSAFAEVFQDPFDVLRDVPVRHYPQFDEAGASVIPESGLQTRVALRDSVVKLVDHGVIDREKYYALRHRNGPFPLELSGALTELANKPSTLTRQNAVDYVNLLWPIGLANHMISNFQSPIAGAGLANFASTAGWTLGEDIEGGGYFNKFPIVPLTPAQEKLVVRIARATYRPCCNNSTFFQDCNHGSALLGVLQLGVAQGLDEKQLLEEALAFNSFWFPDYYVKTALYFSVIRNTKWRDVDPRLVMGEEFSALGPWWENVDAKLAAIPDLIPESQGGANCGA